MIAGRYDTPPRRLEDDPVFRRHATDFAEYHTRYVAADVVRDALDGSSRTAAAGTRTGTKQR